MSNHTNLQVAEDFAMWREYFDTGATMTEAEFNALSIEKRVAMLVDAFGTDEQQADE